MTSNFFLPFSCILFLASIILAVHWHLQEPHLRPNELSGKGDTVKSIRDVKLYLAHFGYLNYQKNLNLTDIEDDDLDEELEVAIKSYQVNYHLNATGTLDEPTVSQMMMPRCGCPDKVIHKNTGNSLHTVSRYRFVPGTPKWPRGQLTYGFGPSFPTQFMPAVDRAFGKWATASSGYFTFSRAGSYQGADLKISFERGDHGDGYPFNGSGEVLAHAFPPPDGRLHFDADENWVIGAVKDAFDLETMALHEIGHLLGLGHSQFQTTIMWSSFSAGVTKGLTSDDIQGLRILYGVTSDDIQGLGAQYGLITRYGLITEFSWGDN
ncbi:metalloendoproteinase 1 [Lactuca sativa]|uniref:Peptidase metallopeptidase domain-containing protein n=1 Tax=Lactuca sativa TaxID=4236 RepID=A0A9R1WVK8_LACSA|nr:metalloendoproteinase 1 [Lactuca sativa]KAJ0188169.1 hypothetical protein LSAT_V11C900500860 [Lactuca sativa]